MCLVLSSDHDELDKTAPHHIGPVGSVPQWQRCWPVFVHAERNWKYPTEMNAWNMGQDVSKIFDGVWAPNHPNQYPVTPRWNLDMTIFNRNVSQTSWNSIQDL
jgi:hypothetical protein